MNSISTIIVLASGAFFLVVSGSPISSSDHYVCPEPNGFFIDPANPHDYYECVNDHPYHFHCPAGLVFNEEISACDYHTGPRRSTTKGPTVPPPTGTRPRHTTPPHGDDHQTTPVHPSTSVHPSSSPAPTPAPTSEQPASTRGRHHTVSY